MKRETLFLKLAVFLMALPVLALCIFAIPNIAFGSADYYPEVEFLKYPVLVGLYVTALAYFLALYQSFRLLGYIDKNVAFSDLSVKALKNIKHCSITISIVYVILLPLIYVVAERDDAPGLILVGMALIFAPLVVAIFAAVLQKLLKNAIDIKSENDLTV
ncbi:DUF2975 domain-containing protein [Terribacillus saccharophilus]|uniref:DUF2975 domain-containing protein n=1 Tax=Terribacillus saccharophilus TaxID=361277 RepID=A0ABX4GZV8_9BACI|nr:DUF2975 domain-containing protein [Terribacillus saccharophilus]PAD36105.1 hypothetical protein CHH56_06730 [Terribacillus saccharophilus]PAD96845.1 hypothetical protein CHH50_05580 [Terribacillus saccharophilus]PAE00421.1 hypothetical protein CHH48_06485 [Terribacillus saccharophilus]